MRMTTKNGAALPSPRRPRVQDPSFQSSNNNNNKSAAAKRGLGLGEIHKRNSDGPRRSNLRLLKQEAASFADPGGVNPFVGAWTGVEGTWNKTKLVVLSPLALVRLLLCIGIVLFCAAWSRALLIGHPPDQPISKARGRLLRPILRGSARALLLVLGFWYIRVVGNRDKRASVVVSNHTTLLDVVVLLWSCSPAFLSKQSVLDAPLLGSICRALQVIGVTRESNGDKQLTKEKMIQHVKHPDTPQLLVFPEGTTSRADTMLRFKPGAFIFGVPVQPVVLFYRFQYFDPSNTATTTLIPWLAQILTQFYQVVELEYLPVVKPDETERTNPPIFANNVREVMLRALSRRFVSAYGPERYAHDVEQTVDDFLVWRFIISRNIRDARKPMNTYSMHSVRRALSLCSPAPMGYVNLSVALSGVVRYVAVLNKYPSQDDLLDFASLAKCMLGVEEPSLAASEAFASVWAESVVFNASSHRRDAFDVRSFITGLIFFSPLGEIWASPEGGGGDPSSPSRANTTATNTSTTNNNNSNNMGLVISDAPISPTLSAARCARKDPHAFERWFRLRARLCFALLTAPSRDNSEQHVSKKDMENCFGREFSVKWNELFGSNRDSVTLPEFRDTIADALVMEPAARGSLDRGGQVDAEEDAATVARRLAAAALLDSAWVRIDDLFRTATGVQEGLFLKDADSLVSPRVHTTTNTPAGDVGDQRSASVIAAATISNGPPDIEEGIAMSPVGNSNSNNNIMSSNSNNEKENGEAEEEIEP